MKFEVNLKDGLTYLVFFNINTNVTCGWSHTMMRMIIFTTYIKQYTKSQLSKANYDTFPETYECLCIFALIFAFICNISIKCIYTTL